MEISLAILAAVLSRLVWPFWTAWFIAKCEKLGGKFKWLAKEDCDLCFAIFTASAVMATVYIFTK